MEILNKFYFLIFLIVLTCCLTVILDKNIKANIKIECFRIHTIEECNGLK